jgi:hypothetical protein
MSDGRPFQKCGCNLLCCPGALGHGFDQARRIGLCDLQLSLSQHAGLPRDVEHVCPLWRWQFVGGEQPLLLD